MIFGPKRVILIVGMNKVVRDADEAVDRIKNVIVPYHAMTKRSKTPCAIELRCTGLQLSRAVMQCHYYN